MRSVDTNRDPCPDRILEDAGSGFGMGAVGGSVFHFVKGLYNSPRGHRLGGGATAVRMNAPRVGGAFAVWGGLYSTFDCAFVYARKKEDPWNSILAGATTGGLLSLRHGLVMSCRAAAFGAAFLALIEGVGIMMNRSMVAPPPPLQEDLLQSYSYPGGGQYHGQHQHAPPVAVQEIPVPDSGPAGWLGSLFGRKRQTISGGDLKAEVLEMDLPPSAIPSFDLK